MRNILSSILICLLVFSHTKAFCQAEGIKIEETCPDVELQQITNFKTAHAKISDFKGKLLILDFWATWCAPCISMIPATDSLQKEFEGKIQILPVTDQDVSTVTTFMNSMRSYKNNSKPSVINDKVLSRLFPHVEIPHYVWLDEDNKVIAITGAEQLTAKTIRDFLNKKGSALPVKEDNFKTIPGGEPMFVTGNELIENHEIHFQKIDNSDLLYHSVITKFIDGFGCEQATGPGRITCKNTSIGDLYRMAASHYNLANLGFNSTIWETSNEEVKKMSDSASIVYSKTRDEINNWMRSNTFCYELQIPSSMQDNKYDFMLRNLNEYFGSVYNINGSMERRKTQCLALIKIAKNKMPDSSASKNEYAIDEYHLQLKSATVPRLISMLSINLDRLPPLIDETNDTSKFDIDLKCNLSDLNSVNSALMPYGFQLIEKVTEREMIVIKDKPLVK
jgi:thiol-disulfide isomerase/thioredoxin